MRNKFLYATIFSAFALASCNSAAMGDSAPSPSPTSMQSGGDGALANGGETVELQAQSPFDAAAYEAFNEPWALAFEPGTGVIFITEKPGTMKFFDPANGQLGTVSGMPSVAYAGQGGLGDDRLRAGLCAKRHDLPDLGEAGRRRHEGRRRSRHAGLRRRGQLPCRWADADLANRARPCLARGHYSHRIAFSPDGQHLFVSSGDRQAQDPAQDTSNNLGTIVRLNLDGTAAAGNPFADRGSPTDQIWTYGHRNMLGLEFDLRASSGSSSTARPAGTS